MSALLTYIPATQAYTRTEVSFGLTRHIPEEHTTKDLGGSHE